MPRKKKKTVEKVETPIQEIEEKTIEEISETPIDEVEKTEETVETTETEFVADEELKETEETAEEIEVEEIPEVIEPKEDIEIVKETNRPERKFKTGDKVLVRGMLFKDIFGKEIVGCRTNLITEIKNVSFNEEATRPYLVNDGLGWVSESSIELIK